MYIDAVTPTLVARDLSKTIGKRSIVDGISLELLPGEIFGFLGPNGAGKTTTIRMLVGLIRPTRGEVAICGFDLRKEYEAAIRNVGCIVETPDLYKFMTGRENLEHFGRMLGGVSKDEIERVGALVDLTHRLDDRVSRYSLGMRQRLGIAQALLGSPRLLILDEPANGLDPAGIHEIRSLLRKLAREREISIFISSHLLAEIELICDRVAIIHRGSIIASGTVAELIATRKEMEFGVDDFERARAIAADLGFAASNDDHTLLVAIGEAEAPRLLAALHEAGIAVSRAQPRERTLEEMFLEATGGETVQ